MRARFFRWFYCALFYAEVRCVHHIAQREERDEIKWFLEAFPTDNCPFFCFSVIITYHLQMATWGIVTRCGYASPRWFIWSDSRRRRHVLPKYCEIPFISASLISSLSTIFNFLRFRIVLRKNKKIVRARNNGAVEPLSTSFRCVFYCFLKRPERSFHGRSPSNVWK